MNDEPLAGDIYERLEMNANGDGGSVLNDIAEMVADGDYDAFEDYFGDTDPFEYL